MSGFRYFPGQSSGPRQFQGYNPRQEANWEILNRAYYSASFGYGHTQMAFPGSRIDPERYESWREKFLLGWKAESSRTPGTRGMDTGDFPEGHLRHIYLSMMEVEAAHPKALEAGEWEPSLTAVCQASGVVHPNGTLGQSGSGIESVTRNSVGDYTVRLFHPRDDSLIHIELIEVDEVSAIINRVDSSGINILTVDMPEGAPRDSGFMVSVFSPEERGYEIRVDDWDGDEYAPINAELIQCDCTPQHREPLIPLPDSGFSLH